MVNDIRLRSQESMANLEVITENVADIVVDINALKNLWLYPSFPTNELRE